jgi:hypothetical protein
MLALLLTLFLAPKAAAPPQAAETAPATSYVDVTVRYERGALSVVKVSRGTFARPTSLRRFRGRFEARALKGATVREWMPFDFPLLADDPIDDATVEAQELGQRLRSGLTATTTVRLPLPADADGALIYDTRSKQSVAVTLTR